MERASILVIGAGPCGLACARELERLGRDDWLVLESSDAAGGLARSVLDPAGFTWDLGGHVVFSHFGEFDALLSEVMGDDVLHHDRSSYVRFGEGWVPYPFQNNLRHLPEPMRDECLEALAAAPGAPAGTDFGAWIEGTFGTGIGRHFMRPYNLKVWATALEEMSADWIAERVAVVDAGRAARNVREGRDDLGWGPNNEFVFPRQGGTGEIYRRLAERLGDRVRLNSRVVAVDGARRQVKLAGGETLAYDQLVSTMPLDLLVQSLNEAPAEVREAAGRLRHNSVRMVGVGVEAPLRDARSWLYFPQPELPFYRVTNFAKYSPANVPYADTTRFSSFMTEVAHSPQRPVRRAGLEERVVEGLRAAGLLEEGTPVRSIHVEEIPYAYPVPTLERDAALARIQPWLMDRGILSRGRFGAWCYEIGNMDHAVKMGIDAARLLVGGEEELWQAPAAALAS